MYKRYEKDPHWKSLIKNKKSRISAKEKTVLKKIPKQAIEALKTKDAIGIPSMKIVLFKSLTPTGFPVYGIKKRGKKTIVEFMMDTKNSLKIENKEFEKFFGLKKKSAK